VRLDRFTVGYHIRELASEGRLEGKRKGRYVQYWLNGKQ